MVTHLELKLTKGDDSIDIIFRMNYNETFTFSIERKTLVGCIVMYPHNCPVFKSIDYEQRYMIRWIVQHADELIDKLK